MNTNFERFTKQILKFSTIYLMWNLKICQDAPNQEQDDLLLLLAALKP